MLAHLWNIPSDTCNVSLHRPQLLIKLGYSILNFCWRTIFNYSASNNSTYHQTVSSHLWHWSLIKNTDQHQVLSNPTWSLRWVKLLMQNNISTIQLACLPFLKTSYAGWLHKRVLTSVRWTRRHVTGILGTGLGVLNGIDSEVIINKLVTINNYLNKLQHPLWPSLLALGTNQWLLTDILPQWERINEKDRQLIIDTLSVVKANISGF